MGIGSITSMGSMAGVQTLTAGASDPKIKSIQNEIKDAQQQMQKLSSEEELSVNEKADERKKLQKEISDLNAELKQHQEELRRSQNRERIREELRENKEPAGEEKQEDKIDEIPLSPADEKNPMPGQQQTGQQDAVIASSSDGVVILKGEINADEGKNAISEKEQADAAEKDTAERETETTDDDTTTDTNLPHQAMHAMVAADTSVQQADRQGVIVARTSDGIAILKSEIAQDEKRDVNTERKQAELEKMEQREERAMAFQFSVLGEANHAMKSASANASGKKSGMQASVTDNAFLNAWRTSQEDAQASQQQFLTMFPSFA